MTSSSIRSTKRSVWFSIAILFLFVSLTDTIIFTQQTTYLYNKIKNYTQKEFRLFEKLVASFLVKGDYSAVEDAAKQWGQEQNDVVEIKIKARNSFSIVDYQNKDKSMHVLHFSDRLHYGDNHFVDITLGIDSSNIKHELNELLFQLVVFSIVLFALFGFIIQRITVLPLRQEIEQHLEAEAKLRKTANEINEINQELESFSYSLSHDLRAPLRSITSFSQIILQDAKDKLDADTEQYLHRVIESGKHMAELIDDILDLARVSRAEMSKAPVNLTKIVNDSIRRNSSGEDTQKISWQVQDNMEAYGNESLLAVLYDNLISNAIKYSNKLVHPHIKIGQALIKGEPVYYVSDNGIGFNMSYATKIFEPFRRFHQEKEFSGTGIGLAIVHRIVQRHQGKIWAESVEKEKTTFYFTLAPEQNIEANLSLSSID